MSLINDALRRTSQTQSPPPAPAETPPLRPVEPEPPRPPNLAWVLMPDILLLLALAGWFWMKWWENGRAHGPTRVAAREFTSASDIAQSPAGVDESTAARSTAAPRRTNGHAAASNAGTGTNTTPSLPAASAEPPRPAEPAFKLQGIFYRPNNASAMINNKTVYAGEAIGPARVLAIGQFEVRIEVNGQTNVLSFR